MYGAMLSISYLAHTLTKPKMSKSEISQRKFVRVKGALYCSYFQFSIELVPFFSELTMMDEDYLSDDKIATRTVNLDDIVADKKETKKIHFNKVSSQWIRYPRDHIYVI
jgi:hypothetical protein